MMKAIGNVLVSVVVFAVVVSALALAFDTKGCTEAARRAVYGPPPEPVNVSMTITPDGSVTVNGERMGGPVAAVKTQVYGNAQVVSGTLGVYNQDQYPILISAPTKQWQFSAGLVDLRIEDITTVGWYGADPQPTPPEGCELVFVVQAIVGEMFADSVETHEFVYMGPTLTWEVVRDFSIRTCGQQLTREQDTTLGPGRNGSPVYAKEVTAKDAWVAIDPPYSWEVRFGDLTLSGTQTWNAGLEEWLPMVSPINIAVVSLQQHKGITGVKFADMALDWDGSPAMFGGRQYTSSPLRFTGAGNTVTVDLVANFAGSANHSVALGLPLIYDFTKFRLPNRSDEDDAGLRISGGFKATNHYPSTLGWSTTP